MKYYSEVLDKVFETPEDLNKAEAESKARDVEIYKAQAAKEAAHKAYKDAYAEYVEASKRYDDLVKSRTVVHMKETKNGKVVRDEDITLDKMLDRIFNW